MKKSNIAEIVREEIESTPFMRDAIRNGIINYSALARRLLPIVKSKTERASEEAVIIAIRRYSEGQKQEPISETLRKVFADSTLSLKGDVVDVSLARAPKVFSAIDDLAREIKWDEGEIMFLTQGTIELGVVTDRKYLARLQEKLGKSDIQFIEKDMAVLSMKSPILGAHTPGLYYFLFGKLAEKGINVYDFVSTPLVASLTLKKEDAAAAYAILDKIIEKSRASQPQ